MDIGEPKTLGRWLGRRLGPAGLVVVVVMVVMALSSHSMAPVEGLVIAVAAAALIWGLEFALFLRLGRRVRRRQLNLAPAGSLFAAPAFPDRARIVGGVDLPRPASTKPGRFALGPAGLSYVRPGETAPEVSLAWPQVSSLSLKPLTAMMGRLEVSTDNGQVLSWRLGGTRELAAALITLRDGTAMDEWNLSRPTS